MSQRNTRSIQRSHQQDKALLRQIHATACTLNEREGLWCRLHDQGTLTSELDTAIRSRFRGSLKEAPYA